MRKNWKKTLDKMVRQPSEELLDLSFPKGKHKDRGKAVALYATAVGGAEVFREEIEQFYKKEMETERMFVIATAVNDTVHFLAGEDVFIDGNYLNEIKKRVFKKINSEEEKK